MRKITKKEAREYIKRWRLVNQVLDQDSFPSPELPASPQSSSEEGDDGPCAAQALGHPLLSVCNGSHSRT